jgi:3',5'-cyclic AMP phosphodiesterase CpdA
MMQRRHFLASGAALAGLSLTGHANCSYSLGQEKIFTAEHAPFHFVHLTDLHIQPELAAADGVRMCLEKIQQLQPRPDFVITGGDLIMDALHVDADRIQTQWKLFDAAFREFDLPVYHTLGNHDVGGWSKQAKVAKESEFYGKRYFAEHYGKGKTYRRWLHQGWQFVVLDSIGQSAASPDYIGLIDEPQLEWLQGVLTEAGPRTPTILVTHIPFLSTWHHYLSGPQKPIPEHALVTNAHQFRQMLAKFNIRLILSGHGHIRERIDVGGITHIQSGAVCGRWWKGKIMNDAEAFGVVTCHADRFDYRYESYGWQAREA